MDTSCDFTGTRGSDFSSAASVTGCTLVTPSGGSNAVSYDGALHWHLSGELGSGESGVIVFDVLID